MALARPSPVDAIARADSALARHQLAGYKLHVIQGGQSDSLLLRSTPRRPLRWSGEHRQKVIEQSQHLHRWRRWSMVTHDTSLRPTNSPRTENALPASGEDCLSNVREVETTRPSPPLCHGGGGTVAMERRRSGEVAQWLRVRTQPTACGLSSQVRSVAACGHGGSRRGGTWCVADGQPRCCRPSNKNQACVGGLAEGCRAFIALLEGHALYRVAIPE